MIKGSLLGVVLLSLLVIGGCAKGGNGIVPTVMLNPSTSASAIYPAQQVTFTAVTTSPADAAVTWTLGPASTCTGTPNPCGQIVSTTPPSAGTSATATYQAPPCQPPPATVCLSGVQPTLTATINGSSPPASGSSDLGLVDVTTEVAPSTLSVGNGLSQQFTAVAVPDYAPQTLTWSCSANGNQCVNFGPDPNVAGAYLYKASDNCSGNCVQISASSTLDPSGCTPNPKFCTIAAVSLTSSRVSGTYAFQFSGYDNSNNPIAVAGTFTASSSGSITSGGVEEVLTKSGPAAQNPIAITGGSYAPSSDPYNSNNVGTLTLLPSGSYPYKFQVVLDGAGDIEMNEIDGNGTGSGIAKISNSKNFNGTTDQTYAFGFTGVDAAGNRVGYVGVLPINGSGAISGGQVDVNDNGTANSYSSVAGTYTQDVQTSGLWHVTGLTLASGTTLDFDFFVASGSSTSKNPLTFYAISTDTVGASHPAAVSGTMVLQDSTQTYNNAALDSTSVFALTGVSGSSTNVALILGSTDGSGDFFGSFDQNDAGTVLSAVQFPGAKQSPSPYTYATSGTPANNGRYIFQMLGNPTASSVVAPIPFVLYASGAGSGFLLDQSSSSVMTGTMNPQGNLGIELSSSEFPGTYAEATTVSASPGLSPITANLFATWAQPSGSSCTSTCLTGTQYPGSQTVTGTYTVSASGTGTIARTAPSTETYVIYVVNTIGCKATAKNANPACAVQSFYVMGSCTIVPPATSCTSGPWPPSSILYAQE